MDGESNNRLYEASSRLLLWLMGVPGFSGGLTRLAKIWLRQARVVRHLAASSYDGVIDGGASIGEFAALVRFARPDLPLLCVEPHPASARVLRRRGFVVVEAALWREPGRLRLTQPTSATTSCTVMSENQQDHLHWDVQSVRLADLPVSGRRLLIKLDLQGAEPEALEGMGDLWGRCAGLLLEVSYGTGGTYEALRSRLLQQGFVEAATFNELDAGAVPIEADKLWLRKLPAPER